MRLPFLIALVSALSFLFASCSLLGPQGCKTDEIPDTPGMVSVVQDPETFRVTAVIQDNSDNEQWITLERSFVSRFTRPTVVGISVEVVDREKLPLDKDKGDTVTIVDRGVVEGEIIDAGQPYSYTARAWNCYGWSEESNEIIITGLETD